MTASRRAALAAVLACGYVCWHLATLTRSPLPYFDDTYFASVGHTFTETGEMRLNAGPLWTPGVIYLYGPIYFTAQRTIFRLFGFGLFQNRILALTCGIAMIGVVFALLRAAGVRARLAGAASLLLALDPTLNVSLHGGRMDTVALVLVLASLLVLPTTWRAEEGARLGRYAAAGLLAALGVLTTPRPAYLVVVIGGILLTRVARRPTRTRALQLLAWSLPLGALYLAWIAYAFGSLGAWWDYYGRVAGTYVGGGLAVRVLHYPLLASLVAVAALRRAAGLALARSELAVFALVGVVAFHALGINPPRFGTAYAIFMVPLAYLALACLASDLEGRRVLGIRGTHVAAAVFLALVVFNGAAFAARSVIELAQWQPRDPAPIAQLLRTHVPPGARVIGDDKFYFAVLSAGSDFQYWQRGATTAERAAYHADTYDFDYVLTSAAATSELFRTYAARVPLREVATIARPEPAAPAEWLSTAARALKIEAPLVGDYAGTLFVRAGRDPRQR